MSYRHREKEVTETKTKTTWRRMYRVMFSNPSTGEPRGSFGFEEMEEIGGVVKSVGSDIFTSELDPQETFDVLDDAGNVVSTIKVVDVWRAIKSLYYHLDKE